MSDFQLGQRVTYTKHILRRDSRPGEFTGPNRLWSSELYPGTETDGGEGIIIGKRTVQRQRSLDWLRRPHRLQAHTALHRLPDRA